MDAQAPICINYSVDTHEVVTRAVAMLYSSIGTVNNLRGSTRRGARVVRRVTGERHSSEY